MTNRLINETSPYLLQHAENPVDWYPWGDEAFERAVNEDKPVLVSIGYSACHWCHVMEKESFENPEIARIMNENFINIKVDREEHPDIDAIYMAAVQAITGSGGWPLNVFLTPQKRPYYGGTYFPPETIPGRPGFPTVLEVAASAYKNRKEQVENAADEIIAYLNQSYEIGSKAGSLNTEQLDLAYASLKPNIDIKNGGFGSAPKFPQPMTLEFLLRQHHRTGDQDALFTVERTLDRMAKGGIYDQIGGGFHRYSVDERWLVPHFEKMLYDNALLSRVYLHAFQATGKEQYRRIVEETLDYVLREMTDTDGGFYSTQDADSEGVEGKYYTWKLEELREILGNELARIAAYYYDVTERGNFEGTNILNRVIDEDVLAHKLGITTDELMAKIYRAKAALLEERTKRVSPHRDEKVLTDWNGLMLASLAEAAVVLDRNDYLEAALANASFMTKKLFDGKILHHVYKDGKAKIDGYLLDYAAFCEGLIRLYQVTFDDKWLTIAITIADSMIERFWDESRESFYDTAIENDGLIVRPRDVFDNAVPSGSAAATFVLIHIWHLTGDTIYEKLVQISLMMVHNFLTKYPTGFGYWLCALEFYLSGVQEIAIIGYSDDDATKTLTEVINSKYLPNKVLAGKYIDRKHDGTGVAFLRGKDVVAGKPAVYVCEGQVCREPVVDSTVLEGLLESLR